MSEQAPFYIFTTFVLTYGTERARLQQGLPAPTPCWSPRRCRLFSVPFFGHLSDMIGRKRMYCIGHRRPRCSSRSRTSGCSTRRSASSCVLAIVLSLILHDMQYGPQAALIAESFPTRRRYSGAGLGYQLASVIAGGPAPLLATWLLHRYDSSLPIGIYIAACGVVTLIATALLARAQPRRGSRASSSRGWPSRCPSPRRRPRRSGRVGGADALTATQVVLIRPPSMT